MKKLSLASLILGMIGASIVGLISDSLFGPLAIVLLYISGVLTGVKAMEKK